MITPRDAAIILDKNGFRVPNGGLDRFGEITYNDERVGTVYYDSVSLSTHYLSIEDKPMTIQYKDKDAVELLEKALDLIVNYDFEPEKRMHRVNAVRKYFQLRKECRHDTESILRQCPSSFDYSKWCKKLKTP